MHLVLNEEVDQRYEGAKERSSQVFPVLDRFRIGWAQSQASQRPRQCRDEVADHENVVPVVVIRARDVRPSTARQRPEYTHAGDELGQSAPRSVGQAVEQEDQHEAWAGSNGDEDLEDRSFGVAVADCGGDGGKPFDGIAVVFVLHDLIVVQPHPDD